MGLFDVDFNLEFDPERFANELVAGSDIDDASKAALASILAKPEVTKRLKNGVALRADAQRAMDKARDVAGQAERVRDANFQWAAENKSALEEWAKSRGNGGGGGGNPQSPTVIAPSGDSLSRAEVIKLLEDTKKSFSDSLAQQDEAYVGLIADTVELTSDYARRFKGESLPYSDLQKFALANRMTLRNAYDKFIQPKLDEQRTADIERIKKEAFEEGRLAALSTANEDTRSEPGSSWKGPGTGALGDVLMGRRVQTLTSGDGKPITGEDAFVANWNKTQGFTKDTGTAH